MTFRTTLAVLLALLVLGGCADDESPEASPRERLTAAKAALDQTAGVRIALATEKLPKGVDGLLGATGVGTHAPAFEGNIRVATIGFTADVDVVAVDGVVHAKLPFTTEFVEVDPADYNAPDPAQLMAEDGGLSSLLTAAKQVKAGEQVRDGRTVLSTFTATLPGQAVSAVIPSAAAEADYDARFTLDDSDRLRRVVMTGPFYPGAGAVTYTVEFEQYGIEKQIRAP
jgi:lipoprotein LprG